MRTLLLCSFCLLFLSVHSQDVFMAPYNPDVNADSVISTPDLLGFLPLFGTEFAAAEMTIDGQTLSEYIAVLEEAAANANASDTVTVPLMPGTAPGEMLYWDGEAWMLVPTGNPGDGLMLDGTTPAWRAQRIGCTDMEACNYEPESTVLDPSACLYTDVCGVCDGPGEIYDCGCQNLPVGDCDCNGNQLDALNVCGGTCLEDVDGDGICDDDGNDDCIGVVDECGICNGPGAIYDCGCAGIAPDACDCLGTPDVDQDGICDNIDPCIGVDDSDGDGICDDADDCDGTYDGCGVCNGPGPIYDCGCSDIPEGDCDCAGNQPDAEGNCQDYAADTNGDGLYDTLLEACLNQSSYTFDDQTYDVVAIGDQCWFQENLQRTQFANGDDLDVFPAGEAWNNTLEGAYGVYGDNEAEVETYGLLYNYAAAADPRNVCPTGWRVSTENDWQNLIYETGNYFDAGALKEAGTLHWAAPNSGATNESGFTALPGGERGFGAIGDVERGTAGLFWTSDGGGGDGGRSVRLEHDNEEITVSTIGASRGQAIRCLKVEPSFGCTDVNFLEYDPTATVDDGGCLIPSHPGCMDDGFEEFDPQANVDDGSCATLVGCSESTAVNYGGYEYAVVGIGTQCWFKENLRVTNYRNGDEVQNLQDPVEWSNTNSGAYVAVLNDNALAAEFGYLYNGMAVTDSRHLCPVGWHVATDEEWKTMESFLGVPFLELDMTGIRGEAEGVGEAMRMDYPNDTWYGTNTSGFSGWPGGSREGQGYFSEPGFNGRWWAPSENGSWYSFRELDYGTSGIFREEYMNPRFGLSVRCLRSNLGCTNSSACNYEPLANEEDGSCDFLSCAVCNIASACNYQNPGSYVNNAVCDFPAIGFDCDGNCLPEYLDENGNCTGVEPCEFGLVEMSIGTFLGASEIEVTPFQASGTLSSITVVSNWYAQGSSYPGDMALAIVSPDGTIFGLDGYNTNTGGVGYPPNYLDDWPSDWNTSSPGVYYAQFTIPEGMTGDGVWSVVVMNAWTSSQTVEYDLTIEINGLCTGN